MIFQKRTVADGISLSVIESDKFKAGVIAFSLSLPLSKPVAAHTLLLSGMLRRGTRSYPTMAEINRRLDELYGSYVEVKSVHLGRDLSLVITAEVLDNKYVPDGTDALGGVIELIAEILLCPVFLDSDAGERLLGQEIRIATDNLNAEINNTRVYAVRRCSELMRGENSPSPTVSELKTLVASATLEDAKKVREAFIRRSPLEVFYIGATPREQIEEKLCAAFAEHRFAISKGENFATPLKRERFAEGFEKMPVSQSKLTMGFSTGTCITTDSNDCYAALMLNEIFGGSASSKLFLNVREKMSLCYYCSSSFSIYTGVITVSSGIEADKLGTVKDAILEQLEAIRRGEISEQELLAARKSILHGYRQLYDSPFDLQSFYSGRMAFGIDESVEDCMNKLADVKCEDVVRIAQRISLDALFFIEGAGGNSGGGADEEDENE